MASAALIRRFRSSPVAEEMEMAIGNAVQRGSLVFAYDENNRQIFAKPAGSGPNDGLTGYTSSRVSIRRGNLIYVYDEKGRQVGATPAR